VGGMFEGLAPTLLREMPGYFVFFGTYEGVKEALPPSTASTFLAGGLAGVSLWTATFPFDVIKSRQQVGVARGRWWAVGGAIIREEGIGALYCGLRPTLVRTFPATGVLLLTVEYVKAALGPLV